MIKPASSSQPDNVCATLDLFGSQHAPAHGNKQKGKQTSHKRKRLNCDDEQRRCVKKKAVDKKQTGAGNGLHSR